MGFRMTSTRTALPPARWTHRWIGPTPPSPHPRTEECTDQSPPPPTGCQLGSGGVSSTGEQHRTRGCSGTASPLWILGLPESRNRGLKGAHLGNACERLAVGTT